MFLRTALITLAFLAPAALAGGALPLNPVMNSGFELQLATDGGGGYADGALYWAEGFGSNVVFADHDGDGDLEAVLPYTTAGHHNMWQTQLPPLQAVSANFESFEFTVESGTISRYATNQIGLALSPGFAQHPWLGIFWEGAVAFHADDMVPDANGRVSMDPATQGSIVCPDWDPCREYKAAWDAADTEGRRTLLGQARVIQVSFWSFNQRSEVVLDDIAIVGATTFAEEAGNVRLAPSV